MEQLSDIAQLRGLGQKSAQSLADVGVRTAEQLRELGAVAAFAQLQVYRDAHGEKSPSLNFLYAMVGALENRSWLDVAQNDRERLLAELDGLREQEKRCALS